MTDLIQSLIDDEVSDGNRGLRISGEFLLSEPLIMPPNFTLEGSFGAKSLSLVTAPGVSLPYSIDFHDRSASGSALLGVTVKGERNNDWQYNSGIRVLDADDVQVEKCVVTGIPGSAIRVRDGKRTKIKSNTIDDVFLAGVIAQRSTSGVSSDLDISDNSISRFGMHAMMLVYASNSRVVGNRVSGRLVWNGLNIAADGSDFVSSLSGSFFDASLKGQFIIMAGGVERLVMEVISATQLRLDLNTGPYASAPACFGNGDLISVQGASDCLLSSNRLQGGASLGISVFSDSVSSADRNNIVLNDVQGLGSAGISVQNTPHPTYVRDTIISQNQVVDCGFLGASGDTKFNVGIAVHNGNTFGVTATSNIITGYSNTMLRGLTFNAAIPASTRHESGNIIRGCVNNAVQFDA